MKRCITLGELAPLKGAALGLSVDLSKAFDTIRWDAIMETLKALGFSSLLIQLIKNCI